VAGEGVVEGERQNLVRGGGQGIGIRWIEGDVDGELFHWKSLDGVRRDDLAGSGAGDEVAMALEGELAAANGRLFDGEGSRGEGGGWRRSADEVALRIVAEIVVGVIAAEDDGLLFEASGDVLG
jgi:hypothetical protein